jgi:hypothetical protein
MGSKDSEEDLIDVIIQQDINTPENKTVCKFKFNDKEISNNPSVVGYIASSDFERYDPVFMLPDGRVTTKYKDVPKTEVEFREYNMQRLIDQERARRKELRRFRKEQGRNKKLLGLSLKLKNLVFSDSFLDFYHIAFDSKGSVKSITRKVGV